MACSCSRGAMSMDSSSKMSDGRLTPRSGRATPRADGLHVAKVSTPRNRRPHSARKAVSALDDCGFRVMPWSQESQAPAGAVAGPLCCRQQGILHNRRGEWSGPADYASDQVSAFHNARAEEAPSVRPFRDVPKEGYMGHIPRARARDHRGPSPVCFHDDMYWHAPIRRERRSRSSIPRFDEDGIYVMHGRRRRRLGEEVPEEEKQFWSRLDDANTWYTKEAPEEKHKWLQGPWNLKVEKEARERAMEAARSCPSAIAAAERKAKALETTAERRAIAKEWSQAQGRWYRESWAEGDPGFAGQHE